MIKNRIEKLREKMTEFECDGVVIFNIFNNADLRYFTGADIEGVLVVDRDEANVLVSSLYYQRASDVLGDNVVLSKDLDDVVNFLKKKGVRKLGVDFGRSTHRQVESLSDFQLIDFSNKTLELRMIKERDEINQIKRAAYIARNAFMKVYPMLKPGITEKELADELSYQIRKNGGEKEAFQTIVASGANAAYPHHIPTEKPIEEGEFVVIDFGASVNGYNSDMTYTFLMGEKSDEKKELFNAVFYAQLFATEMIAPNRTKASEVYKRAKSELAKRGGVDRYFIHGLGHGVGLEVHEFPYLNAESNAVLKPNMIFTIEPGIYIPGKLGIRLEHMVLVKENDVEVIAFTPFVEAM